MLRLLFSFFWTVTLLVPAMASDPWSGSWKVTWPGGGAIFTLEQSGEDVSGSYRNGRGRIEAAAHGREINGQFIEDNVKEGFGVTLGTDLRSFSGYTSAGEWISGLRLTLENTSGSQSTPVFHSPRTTMRSFLDAGSLARDGDAQALSVAVDAIDFGSGPDWASRDAKFSAAEQLFALVDLATFNISSIPEDTPFSQLSLALPRLDATSVVNLDMVRDADGKWRIVMPAAKVLRELAGAEPTRPADFFRQLQSPRDTLRTFLDGMSRWDEGGDLQAISVIDLAGVPDVLKLEQGRLSSQYLVRIIDQVGLMPLQSVPNSGVSREPFVYFEHPAGRIVIEPIGTGADTRWKFSAGTVQDVRRLFAAVEVHPEGHTLDKRLIPPSPLFAVREQVKAYAPALLQDISGAGRAEYWQLLAALLLLAVIIFMAVLLKRTAYRLLLRPSLKRHVGNPRRLALAAGIAAAFATGGQIAPQLGLPMATRQYTVPLIGSVMVLILAYAIWQLIGIVSSILEDYADRTETPVDNILITFVRGLARLVLVGAAGLVLGYLWSVPTTGILAGLGVGGLAIAFASKETLSNVFGAGILLGDRPFQKGDRIIAGEVNGWVEAVGLRSTRIRTLHDSLLIVPNGKLADTTINNLGAIRRRALTTTFLVTSGSTPENLQTFTSAIVGRITSDPFFDGQKSEVNISGIVASGIQIEISTSLNTRHGVESRAATHHLYLDILKMAETVGLTLGRGMEKRPVYVLQET